MRNRNRENVIRRYSGRADEAFEPLPSGSHCSLVAMHEEVLVPVGPKIFGRRRLKVVRIEQRAAPEHQPRPRDQRILEAAPPPARTLPAPTPARGYRKILEEPGIRVTLPYGQIKSEIAPLLKRPQRLQDPDRIECYAQIYEAQGTIPAAHVASSELGSAGLDAQFHPLTRDKAQMLGVPNLFRQTPYPFETRASTRRLYAGQRVYRLRPVFDPTDTPSPEKTPRKRQPDLYANAFQFRHSREEALYDMKALLGTLKPGAGALACWLFIYPLRLIKSFLITLVSGRRLKKWRAMLAGKALDEQLWAVTPPRGFTYHPAVRRWAAETLARAGYDPDRMFVEWEIFWRRKGWS